MSVKDLATRNNVILSLVILIITGIVIYYVYDYIRKLIHKAHNEPILIKDYRNAKAPIGFSSKDLLPSHNAYDATYMIWLNVNDTNWHSNGSKHILNKGGDVTVTMSAKYNNIEVFVKKDDGDILAIKIENFPLQRWFHLVIVNTKQSCEIYVDGELYTSRVINGSIKSHSNSDLGITQNGGFGGFISHLRYYNRVVLPQEIKLIYSKGPKPFTILDLSKLVKKLTPKFNIIIGDYNLVDGLMAFKKDYLNPLADGITETVGIIDNAVNTAAGDLPSVSSSSNEPIDWGYDKVKKQIPTCLKECNGIIPLISELKQLQKISETGTHKEKKTLEDRGMMLGKSMCEKVTNCPSACNDVDAEGAPLVTGVSSARDQYLGICAMMNAMNSGQLMSPSTNAPPREIPVTRALDEKMNFSSSSIPSSDPVLMS